MSNLTCTLCLTQDCTLRCHYCYMGKKTAQIMPVNVARQGLEICVQEAARTGQGLDISFFGGEPLLVWDLLRYCHNYAHELEQQYPLPRPIRYSVTTNGTLLSQEKIQYLAEHDFLVGLSLDGSPAMHDLNRCYPYGIGSHNDVAKALARLNNFPQMRKKIICVVSPNNVHLLDNGVAWLAAHTNTPFSLNIDYWSQWSDAQFDILRHQIFLVGTRILQSWQNNTPIHLTNLEDKILRHILPHNCQECLIGEKEIAITTDGDFYPCSRLIGNPSHCFGNVTKGIDRARQLALISQQGNNTAACRTCDWSHRCLNNCGCTNYAASGKLNQVSPFLCNTEQLLIQTADHIAETLYQKRNPAFLSYFYHR